MDMFAEPAAEEFVRTLQHSAELVKAWGESKLPGGKTLGETLTLQEIPLWDTVAVDLARLHVLRALWLDARPPSFAQRIRSYLSWAKHGAREYIGNRHDSRGCAEWPQASGT